MPLDRNALALFLGILAAPACARPLEAELPPGRETCWARSYDAAHLAAHPRQKVTQIRLIMQPDSSNGGQDYITIEVNLRKRMPREAGDTSGHDYTAGGFCKARGAALVCENEYGLGTWRVEAGRNGGLMVRNGGMIVKPSNHDAEEIPDNAVKLPAKPDDGAWFLDHRTEANCPF